MARILPTIFSLLALLIAAAYAVNPSFEISPTQKSPPKTYIQSVSVSLTVPSVPTTQKSHIGHFFGMSGSGIAYTFNMSAYSTSALFPRAACAAKPGQWCVQAYVLGAPNSGGGAYAVVSAGDVLKMSIDRVGGDGGSYSAKVTRSGSVLSSKNVPTSGSGLGVSFVQSDCFGPGTIPAQNYKGLTIVHALPYLNFNQESTQSGSGSTSSGMYTSDGGATWKVDTVNLLSYQCS